MKLYAFTAVFTPEKGEPDVYTVTVPALPEIVTFGQSRQEARFMAQDALETVVHSRLDENESIPPDKRPSTLSRGSFTEEKNAFIHLVQTSS
ncbi:hypothetical protein A2973_02315 [Candidatus Gottesmanbacteria bacterium RIFCSPLOWO2_01_FULL_49_10]|uniref:HicB-like antitoxin of toxin-antitoxin system domain-containing protein n=1 Tax=Candidatus Gottesmanbacteria bacterium RIFCSPLOWO2_01_FULL_49_10 TaxID=1798396 RepID=A0A1F6AYD9_9BACT|nr:MAG: hypothetical protein A2973_02315 [Candidatus Gottesmanbacteria bacterium RIFCSPLOWO2_01_FULL_49_10]